MPTIPDPGAPVTAGTAPTGSPPTTWGRAVGTRTIHRWTANIFGGHELISLCRRWGCDQDDLREKSMFTTVCPRCTDLAGQPPSTEAAGR